MIADGGDPDELTRVVRNSVIAHLKWVCCVFGWRPSDPTTTLDDLTHEVIAGVLERCGRDAFEDLLEHRTGTEKYEEANRQLEVEVSRVVDRHGLRKRDVRPDSPDWNPDLDPSKRQRKRVSADVTLPEPSIVPDRSRALSETVAIHLDVASALEGLSSTERRIVVAKVEEKKSWTDIATELGLKETAIRNQYAQALAKLAKVLKAYTQERS
jgi:RNA polymerase sigma factor (sigma-70 family)